MRTEYEVEIKIYRHGKTPMNERHCYIGRTDEALSEAGAIEISHLKEFGLYEVADYVFVSPMKRAKETANIAFPEKEQISIEEFKEMDFGSFEGKCYDELKDNVYYRKWIDSLKEKTTDNKIYSDVVLPERKDLFTKRVSSGFERVLKIVSANARNEYSEDSNKEFIEIKSKVAIVAHGGTVMSIVEAFTDNDYYSHMIPCGEGLNLTVRYEVDDNEDVTVSRLSINNRICP